jgi:hypothetical protein
VGPSIPSGRAARDAWRALNPEARRGAFAAASRNVAPPDVGLAWAAAGYGRAMARRYRILVALTPLGVVALMAVAITIIVAFRAAGPAFLAIPLVLLIYVVGMVVLSRRMRRYQRLYNSGLLGVEAAQLGAPVPAPSPAVWATSGYQSEFTVPYEASVPVPSAAPRSPADPAHAGVQEIPLRLGALLFQCATFVVLAAALWINVAVRLATAHTDFSRAITVVWVTLACVMTFLAGLFLLLVVPALRTRVVARFTPSGWELPGAKMAGPWAEVREIRIRQLNVRQSSRTNAALAGYRAVALIVDHPDGYLARLSRLRRALLRRTINRYGSPVVIIASPRRTMPLVDLVRLLQRYTDAPVTWS